MLARIKHVLWGDISTLELKHFGVLAAIFFFVIGSYWILRGVKNAFFMHLVDPASLPYAKMVSISALIVLVVAYNELVDLCSAPTLIYFITGVYGTLFLFIAYALTHPAFAGAWLGWLLYVMVESFGSLVVALFWSYVASVSVVEQAKRGYPVVVAGAQLGAMVGSVFVMTQAVRFGGPGLVVIASVFIFSIPALTFYFHKIHAPTSQEIKASKKQATGVFEGLRLLATRPYLMGILVVSTAAQILSSIFDYLMNVRVYEVLGSLEKTIAFFGLYGLITNGISCFFVLFGSSFLIRRFGLTACLIANPVALALVVGMVWIFPSLWVFVFADVAHKVFSYALNNPCKEIMYIPTSKDVQFKTKSWIDVQGMRTAKGLGAGIVAIWPAIAQLVIYGSVISLGIIGLWLPVAHFVGKKNQQLVESGEIIE
jgi:ATP:ADP antiporter, AAA family